MKCEDVQREVFGAVRRGGDGGEEDDRVEGRGRGGEDVGDEGIGGKGSEGEEEEDTTDADVDGGGVRLPTNMLAAKSSATTTTTATKFPDSNPTKKAGEKEVWHLTPQAYGQKVAKQREQVRQAARRGVAFGFLVADTETETGAGGDGGGIENGVTLGVGSKDRNAAIVPAERRRRKVEAIQHGRIVEASFAKGEWGVRWRE